MEKEKEKENLLSVYLQAFQLVVKQNNDKKLPQGSMWVCMNWHHEFVTLSYPVVATIAFPVTIVDILTIVTLFPTQPHHHPAPSLFPAPVVWTHCCCHSIRVMASSSMWKCVEHWCNQTREASMHQQKPCLVAHIMSTSIGFRVSWKSYYIRSWVVCFSVIRKGRMKECKQWDQMHVPDEYHDISVSLCHPVAKTSNSVLQS